MLPERINPDSKCAFSGEKVLEGSHQDHHPCKGKLTKHHVKYRSEGGSNKRQNFAIVCEGHQSFIHASHVSGGENFFPLLIQYKYKDAGKSKDEKFLKDVIWDTTVYGNSQLKVYEQNLALALQERSPRSKKVKQLQGEVDTWKRLMAEKNWAEVADRIKVRGQNYILAAYTADPYLLQSDPNLLDFIKTNTPEVEALRKADWELMKRDLDSYLYWSDMKQDHSPGIQMGYAHINFSVVLTQSLTQNGYEKKYNGAAKPSRDEKRQIIETVVFNGNDEKGHNGNGGYAEFCTMVEEFQATLENTGERELVLAES